MTKKKEILMKILVTGGAGFIGSHLVNKLSNQNNEVIVLDNLLRGNKLVNKNKNVFSNVCDISDYNKIVDLSKGCDVIFHLAAFLGVDQVAQNPVITMETEVLGTYNIVKAAVKTVSAVVAGAVLVVEMATVAGAAVVTGVTVVA